VEVRLMRLSQPYIPTALLIAAMLLLPAWAGAEPVTYLHNLSNFSGTVPYSDVMLYADRQHDEIYAAVGNFVRVFNPAGMEIYQFLLDPAYGRLFDLAVDESGDILVLTLEAQLPDPTPHPFITRCDYRGEPIERFPITGSPPEFETFIPNQMIYRAGRIVLVSRAGLQVVIVDPQGVFQEGYDLSEMIGGDEGIRTDNEIFGFTIDPQGNMSFTVPALFRVFIVSPDGEVTMFGRTGSVPGSFGVVAGIAADDYGRLLVSDKQRGVVMVFDQNQQFVTEFGAGREGRGSLVRPNGLAVGNDGKVYVTQLRDRGVAVFKLSLSPGDGVIRSDAGPRSRGGVDRGGDTSNVPGQSGTEVTSVFGQSTRPPVTPFEQGGNTRQTDPADPRITGMPETQGGDRR
jgi:hypothetical protein